MSSSDASSPLLSTKRKAAWAGSWASLRDLEVLLTVIEERKTTSAAQKLGVSQPAISRALTQLEQKAGRPLFRHQGIAIVPTADALALYEEIRPIFESLDKLKEFQWGQSKATSLKIAATPTMAQCFLEQMTATFLAQNPGIQMAMEIVTTPDVLALVAEQRVDVGLADVAGSDTGLQRTVFRVSKMVCALPQTHPLATREIITPLDLHEQTVVLLTKRNSMRPILDRLLSKEGSKPKLMLETTTALSAINYVAQGVGITLVNPFPVALAALPGVVLREFSASLAYETSFFTSGSMVSSAITQKFMEHVSNHQPPSMFMSSPMVR
jgi:DNA-binding transcriptional LysR family regulator